ncbi:embryo sac development arrest 6 [Euphorbia peplus]|nr:embryo sac development arrest 6 [Euphorbia peplus]
MSHHSRRIMTFGSTRKRKEREAFYSAQLGAKPILKADESSSVHPSNQLLAGYMAYEYLTKGTLFGQKFEPGRVESVPIAIGGGWMEPKRGKPGAEKKKEHKSYDEVASILKTDGAHLPGIVNPTQLARWIQM